MKTVTRLVNKTIYLCLFMFFSMGVFAVETFNYVPTDGLSFKPSPGDMSMVFLGNIFGIVDGVLAGTGSQITGAMFGVFNSAVLFIGGIILLYSLLVSTLNTSNDGKLAGQKWSSTWVPVRSVMGTMLLLPKASGYCAMQIFIMWVVIQGIGAADSVWNKALNYLNRGGVIMQKQMNPSTSAESGGGLITDAAMGIVAAQVCMQGLEYSYLAQKRAYETDGSSSEPSTCDKYTEQTTTDYYKFCHTEVPNFLNSVIEFSGKNFNVIQLSGDSNVNSPAPGSTVTQPLPYFGEPTDTEASLYTKINGICGQLSWTVYSPSNGMDDTLPASEQQMITNARTIAVYQMYSSLLPVSTALFNNAPLYNSMIDCSTTVCQDSLYAEYYYGYPLKQNLTLGCDSRSTGGMSYNDSNACNNWGTATQSPVILSGREVQDAVATYNGVMLPTLTSNSLNSANNKGEYASRRAFINGAKNQGWLMAGSYFFKLAILNNFVVNKTNSGSLTDNTSALKIEGQVVNTSTGNSWAFQSTINALSSNNAIDEPQCLNNESFDDQPLCQLSVAFDQPLAQLGTLIAGANNYSSPVPKSDNSLNNPPTSFNTRNLNVFTYLVNANSLWLPGQVTKLTSGLTNMNATGFNPTQSTPKIGKMKFSGGKWGISSSIASILWNILYVPVYNGLLFVIVPPIMYLFSFLMGPMLGISANIFSSAISIMRVEGINPILALAQMGVQFIEQVANSWIVIIVGLITNPFSLPMFILVLLLAPLIFTWMGIMVTVGFTAAFYVPFVPLLVFTFASIGWFISVIEGMVAAPIVALGVLHPEGQDDVLGKADTALMLILNMFLRPSLMILGYVFGIALSYVGVWILNAGFALTLHDISFITPADKNNIAPHIASKKQYAMYGFWSNILLYYFSVLTYVTLYLSIVQQAFELIHQLPDKTLRWIAGGNRESLGESSVKSMLDQVKSQSDSAASQSSGAVAKAVGSMQEVTSGGIMSDKHSNMGSGSGSGSAAK